VQWTQVAGSLAVAAAIVAIAIAVVTSKFGTTSAAERELEEVQLVGRQDAGLVG
jgi:hypothetical protein